MAPDTRGEPAARHPDGELLDAYADGERTPGSVDRHVRACADCQRAVVALRNVRVELARLAPIAMPPDVARRISEALSATPVPSQPPASRGRRGRGGRRSPGHGRPPTYGASAAFQQPSRSPHAPHPLAAARSARPERLALLAVCLLVVVAGAGLFTVWQRSGPTSSDSASMAIPAAAAASPTSEFATSAAVADGMVRASAGPRPANVSDSGAALTAGNVPAHARDLLAGHVPVVATVVVTGASAPPSQQPGMSAASQQNALTAPELLGCYRQLAATVGGSVLALDRVSYGGHAGVLVIVDVPEELAVAAAAPSGAVNPIASAQAAPPATGAPDLVQLTIVDLGCDAGHLADETWFSEQARKA